MLGSLLDRVGSAVYGDLKSPGRPIIAVLNQEKEAPMTTRIRRTALIMAAIGTFVGMPIVGGVALAGDKHVAEALEHAKGAVSHGKKGHADACVEHAQEALKHAKAAGVKSPHLDEGIKHLNEAVEHGKAGHADACTQHAEGGVTHLSEVK